MRQSQESGLHMQSQYVLMIAISTAQQTTTCVMILPYVW